MGIEEYLNKSVLIADDLANMREDLIKILRSLGFTKIKEVHDGKAAWDELRLGAHYEEPYEIIFLDINMPRMNGLSLLKALREIDFYKKTPIFIVSTENEKDVILRAIIYGATDYILKPYSVNIVKEKILTRLK
ncbi:MAG: response regulator [Bacteriovorax sp.]|nr:response regulator [Bacteriovorax sp.]